MTVAYPLRTGSNPTHVPLACETVPATHCHNCVVVALTFAILIDTKLQGHRFQFLLFLQVSLTPFNMSQIHLYFLRFVSVAHFSTALLIFYQFLGVLGYRYQSFVMSSKVFFDLVSVFWLGLWWFCHAIFVFFKFLSFSVVSGLWVIVHTPSCLHGSSSPSFRLELLWVFRSKFWSLECVLV